MSLVLLIKDGDRFVLSSDKQVTIGDTAAHNTTKIWRLPDMPSVVMGAVGSARVSQIVQNSLLIDMNRLPKEGITTKFIVTDVVPTLVDCLTHCGIKCAVPEGGFCTMSPNSFLIAFEDRAWRIGHDFSVDEITDYLAIGSGAEIATGVLFATPELNPFDRAVMSIDAAATYVTTVDDGVDFLMTKLHPNDKEELIKAIDGDEAWEAYKEQEEAAAKAAEEHSPAKKTDKSAKKDKKVEK